MNITEKIKNLTPKKRNIIITSIIALVAIIIGTVESIGFVKNTNYEVVYVVRDNVTTEKLSDYCASLKNTEGDATIYKNFGTKNSVLVSKTNYKTIDELNGLNLCIDNERYEYAPFENGKALLVNTETKLSTNDGVNAVKNDQCQGFICSYETAKTIVNTVSGLVISDVEVELFPKMLVLGGTHPYEASGFLTAALFIENVNTERGIFYVIPQANNAGFNYGQEMEARSQTFEVPLKDMNGNVTGTRTFKIGSRYAHTTEQWPTPDMYIHPSGKQVISAEGRNLNRVYPGSANGNFTERVAYGITQFALLNNITMLVDLHEASPEYSPNNDIVYHNDASDIYNRMYLNYLKPDEESRRIQIAAIESSEGAAGLSHRELGDYTNAYVMLCETNDVHEGGLHGALSSDLVTYYNNNDKFYEYAAKLDVKTRTEHFTFWFKPCSIDERVARHTLTIESFIDSFNDQKTQRTEYSFTKLDDNLRHSSNVEENYTGEFIVGGIPSYKDLMQYSLGAYLLPSE